jgi:subtilisin family serine protease
MRPDTSDTIILRQGPSGETLTLSESGTRFVVHFRNELPEGSLAKAALRLPLVYLKRVQPCKVLLSNPTAALFEVRHDEASDTLPEGGDSLPDLRDGVMNHLRSGIGLPGSQVASCFHTYGHTTNSEDDAWKDNDLVPSGQLLLEFHPEVPEEEQRRVLQHYGLSVDRAIVYWRGAFVVRVTQYTGASPVRLARDMQALSFDLTDGTRAHVFDWADPLFHRRRQYQQPEVPSGAPSPLKVFISSTSQDLEQHRAVVRDVVLDMKWGPVMMENFRTSPLPIVEACQSAIEQSDLLILVVAFRRGWQPTREQGGNGSDTITALELAFARSKGVPVIALLASDESWPMNLGERSEDGLRWVEKFRAELNLPAVFFGFEASNPGDPEQLPVFRSKVREALVAHRERLLSEESAPVVAPRRKPRRRATSGLFRRQWHLQNDGLNGAVPGADIDARGAWDITRGHGDVRIAVIDDGFDLESAEFGAEGRIIAAVDICSGAPDVDPTEEADPWHGTSVLALIGAAHNGRGGYGVAPRCTFIPIKLHMFADDDAEARAFDHAVENGAAVINCSWGSSDGYSNYAWPVPRIVGLALEHAYRNDVAVVFAAGNGCQQTAPDGYASHPRVITVSASTDENRRAYYSNYGDSIWACAPSGGGTWGILATELTDASSEPVGSFWSGGTSAAAPLVSGVIGLIQSAYLQKHGASRRLDVEAVKRILRDTALKIDPYGAPFLDYWTRQPVSVRYSPDANNQMRSLAYGYGLVSAGRAVRATLANAPREQSTAADRRPEAKGLFAMGSLHLDARIVGDPLDLFHAGRTQMTSESKNRFESGEVSWLGDRGFQLAFAAPGVEARLRYEDYRLVSRLDRAELFTYGELVALSGDFYASPSDLYWEKRSARSWLWEKSDLSDIRAGFANELAAIRAQQRGKVEYPDNNIAFWWNAKSHVELALESNAHFGWHNVSAYCKHHRAAMEFAVQARQIWNFDQRKARELWGQALFTNAFADHFLTDAFAAGHIRVPRQQLRAWCRARGWDGKLTAALSKLLHDQEGHATTLHGQGHALNEGDGMAVTNSLGQEWLARCDGQLFVEHQDHDLALAAPIEAVRRSMVELFRAHLDGAMPAGIYQALELVPFPHPTAPGLADKFAAMGDAQRADLLDAVRWYVKIPYIRATLTDDHLRALTGALPALMSEFRAGIARDVATVPELSARMPGPLVEAFRTLR